MWRELKKLGAVYLRDGVALVPRRPDLEAHLVAVTERVEEYEGQADLVRSPELTAQREEELVERFREERAVEYKELYHACVRFLRDVLEEVDADDFGFPDVDKLESELGRLRRWNEQIRERDYFGAAGADRVEEILAKCDRAFEQFVKTASERGEGTEEQEDVFERLGGTPAASPASEDYPL